MNRFVRLVKENVLPSIVFAILAVSCVGAWYFYHPASPYHPRYSFVVSYEAIGTLSPGNVVEVRGIKVGEITKVELTEDAVYVTARVYSSTKIPVNSEFRLINSGLMGEREMCILTGDSEQLISEGDTLVGRYDQGTSGVGKSLAAAFEDATVIKDTLKSVLDSITEGSTGKRIVRVVDKGKKIVRVAKGDVKSWVGESQQILSDLDGSLNQAKALLEDLSGKADVKVEEVKSLLNRVDAALDEVKVLKDRALKVAAEIPEKDGSVGLILGKEEQFGKELNNAVNSVEALMQDIKKNGIKLNVDIF